MGIVYLVSLAVLITLFVLIKKSEKTIDIVGFICISIILLFCYNTFICYILTFFTIPCKLWILILINLIISICLELNILKEKQIQRYNFDRLDIIYITIIIIIIAIITIINFGYPFDVNFVSTDPTVHYLAAIRFAEQETLLANSEPDIVYGKMSNFRPVSYVNSGLLMKCIGNNEPIECYNIFVVFGFIVLVLIGTTMYSALKKYAAKKEHILWAFILSIICVLGYPLNSWIFGFEYLTLGILILCTIIELIYYYEQNILQHYWFNIFLGLLCFGLFCSYYMFVPFTYTALWLYFCIKNYETTKKIITKKLALTLTITLIIPFILGFIYTLAPEIYSVLINKEINIENVTSVASKTLIKGFPIEGFIYINLYSNMLLLIPLIIYLFVKKVKYKELEKEVFLGLILIFAILFIEILLIGNSLGKVSMYYLSKNYFALWIILIFCNYIALIELTKSGNYLPRLFLSFYVAVLIIQLVFSDFYLIQSNKNEKEGLLSFMEVFLANKTTIKDKSEEFNQQELEIIKYANNNLNLNSNFEVISTHRAYYWAYVFLRDIDKDEMFYEMLYAGQHLIEAKSFNLIDKLKSKEPLDYLIYFYRNNRYPEVKDVIFENAEIIYENEAGGILRYNK